MKLWMFESWYTDLEEQHEFAKNYAILEGSFINPEAAKQMIKEEYHDFETNDENYEKISQMMVEQNKKEEENKVNLIKKRRKLFNK